ncbi:MAG TPA: carbon starvation protein A [Tepidisphaeraceae bacterium]
MPVMIVVLCCLAIAYRYYSAFLAARVATLDDLRTTPAEEFNDGQNYHPTNKWVLFGHHFAAISGAGPLIGPVLAAQFGYLPGLIWIVVGVCLAGAVQDFLVLAASIRRGGKSLAQIAYSDVGKVAGTAATAAILFIVIIALAGLGTVVVKALGGDQVKYPPDTRFVFQGERVFPEFKGPQALDTTDKPYGYSARWLIPAGTEMEWNGGKSRMKFNEDFKVRLGEVSANASQRFWESGQLPPGSVCLIPGSVWGTFTIACTIPIALFVGLYMYKIRKGHVVEASLIGGALTLVATFLGGFVASSSWGHWLNLSREQVVWSMAAYGFIASVLPVWVLLCPRDYLSSFLKIGTIGLLVVGVIIANPKLEAPAFNGLFAAGNGPTVKGALFPFLFITIMCGAISGFHALVSSGTTPKMIRKESDARMIGYGAMLIEGLVGVVAMIAASTLPVGDYYAMNTEMSKAPMYQEKFAQIGASVDHLNVYQERTQEWLRGRTGGAVTLAVGFAHIFDKALARFGPSEVTLNTLWKYWYHFAIMFEALFILTTIDTGTRIGRFLLQEVAGKIHPKLGETSWMPGAIGSTALIVFGWVYFILNAESFSAIWAMFGVANQMLAVIALAIVSAYLANVGKAVYIWATAGPMVVVMTTTSTAAVQMLYGQYMGLVTQWANPASAGRTTAIVNCIVQGGLLLAMLVCGMTVIIGSGIRILAATNPVRGNRVDALAAGGR